MGTTTPDYGDLFHQALNFLTGIYTDFFAVIVVTLIVAGFAFYFGRNRLMPFIAGMYAGVPLYVFSPFHSPLLQDPYIAISLYIFFVLISFLAFSGLSAFMASAPRSFIRVGIVALLTAGALLAIGMHILPLEQIYPFNAATQALFASSQSFFWWLIAPLVGLFFLER